MWLLSAAIDVLATLPGEIEIILVNDGSTDGTTGEIASGIITQPGMREFAGNNCAATAPGCGRSSRLIVTTCGATRVIGLPIIIQYPAAG